MVPSRAAGVNGGTDATPWPAGVHKCKIVLFDFMQEAAGCAQQLEGVHGQPRQRLGLVLQHAQYVI